MLDDDERRQRPETLRRLRFEDLTTPGPQFRDTSGIVPVESVQAGDAQVLAARGARSERDHQIDIDVLSDHPSVESVVATTRVRSRRPLPSVAELFLFGGTPLPDSETFRNLPGLRRVWLTWAVRGRVDLAVLPPNLQALGIAAHHVPPSSGGGRFAVLQRFKELGHLTLRFCLPKDSVESIGALTQLVELNCDAPGGWARLRTCTALEDVTAIQPRMANFRPLATWTRLRRLTISAGGGLKSLGGLDAFQHLESLRIVLVRPQDLSPIGGLRELKEVSINSFGHPVALEVFSTLPLLESLTIETPGDPSDQIHVETLQPLAAVRTLEAVTLRGVTVSDRRLALLAELPALRALAITGEFGDELDALRLARPDIAIRWFPGPKPPQGEHVGFVLVRPPAGQASSAWWIREDLASRLSVATNYDAEHRIKHALEAEDSSLAARLSFDTEADAVCFYGNEADVRAVARIIASLAKRSLK